jgi:2-dehydropantoate 2-reductase
VKRICVFGAGGVGGYLAGALARAGREVSLVARGPHLEAIRERGLTVTRNGESFTVRIPAQADISQLPAPDIIIVTTKATAVKDIAGSIAPHVRRGAAVIFAMNGVLWFYPETMRRRGLDVPGERLDPDGGLRREIGFERTFGMIIRSGNEVIAPGHVLNNGTGSFVLGAAVNEFEHTPSLADLLDVPGARVTATNDLPRDMWAKVIRNIAVALVCVLLQSTAGEAFGDPSVRAIAVGVMQEAAAIAAVHGFSDVLDIETDADVMTRHLLTKPSIVQDLEKGRSVEIDMQILVLQDFARAQAIATPLIDVLTPFVVLRARLAGAYAPIIP